VSAEVQRACLWCASSFEPRRGGSPQRFCSTDHRSLFWSAIRRSGEHAVAVGILTIADIRNVDPAACTLPGAAILPPQVSWGHVEPGEVLGAAEIVEDKSPDAQPCVRVDTPDIAVEHAELSSHDPTGARTMAEPTLPFEVDPARLWGPRLTLWRRWRMWAPEWGPRPDQDGCLAPNYLL
jgi:hypothetical protein